MPYSSGANMSRQTNQYGYSFSATYPQSYTQTSSSSSTPGGVRSSFNPAAMSSWYQTGQARCSYKGCSFQGSSKSVEIHMMDRHLIYPRGWEKRKNADDWDADPSLKGKPLPIQGTTITLDDPEVLTKWIAERKKRWPTEEHAAEKKRKLAEAVQSGQISPDDPLLGRKRRKTEDGHNRGGRGGGRGRGRGRRRGTFTMRPPVTKSETQNAGDEPQTPATPKQTALALLVDGPSSSSSDSGSDDGPPEETSSRIPSKPISKNVAPTSATHVLDGAVDASADRVDTIPTPMPPRPRQKGKTSTPKRPPSYPFTQRPSLLRQLLLPEIRITLSNLSQAMRFIVDNDFFDDFELKPGQGQEEPSIVVISSNESGPDPATKAHQQASNVMAVGHSQDLYGILE
ncbi:hypothetical protein FISHEDRAFT_46075 [Fistulina hepatica ATCC 64428]|uniref:FMR1-interacting protein 1 conserved domain-containing protein n=1 Tax=Fistulina hepatica ATCC 64428 TaxID=1128425 RepID=A0A0D7A8B8_9AGAR|nr:hypothetical protein FISHEDRAFT_46075 [Fistulina hepatica ATCC 64428]